MPEASGFDFEWRLSVAEVHASGPFSRFAGIDRTLAVLNGSMSLAIDRQGPLEIRARSPALSFSGEAITVADVVEPVTDVNLMTRHGLFQGTLEWIDLAGPATIGDQHADIVILVVDPVLLRGSLLEPFDAVWCKPGHPAVVQPMNESAYLLLARIRRIGDASGMRLGSLPGQPVG